MRATGRSTGSPARGRQRASADDAARQRTPWHGRRLPAAAGGRAAPRLAGHAPRWAAARWCWPALPGDAAARLRRGDVSVQDAAAQRAAPLLLGACGLPLRARVLDACAAPGGKTAHLLERATWTCWRWTATRTRLRAWQTPWDGCTCRPSCGGRRAPSPPPGGTAGPSTPSCSTPPAAPRASCAATPTCAGCAARATSTRWRGSRPDAGRAVAAAAPGGRLLYATCSVFKAEGEHQIDAFLQRQTARPAGWTRPRPATCCPCPTMARAAGGARAIAADGFFYALLTRPPTDMRTTDAPCRPPLHAPATGPAGGLAVSCCAGLSRQALQGAACVRRRGPGRRRRTRGPRTSRCEPEPAGEDGADARVRGNFRVSCRARSRTRCSAACRSTSWPRPTLYRSRWYWRDERVARVGAPGAWPTSR
jgi:hypothetical protein